MGQFDQAIERADLSTVMNRPDYIEQFFDAGVEASAFMQNAQRLPNMPGETSYMSVMSALPVAYFVGGDTNLRKTTDAKWEDKTLQARELAVIVPIPVTVLDDSRVDLQARVKPAIGTAIGKAVDAAVLRGVNAPSGWPTNILDAATAAGHAVDLSTKTDVYEALLDEDGVLAKIELDGYMPSGSIAHPVMKGKFRGNRTSNGQPIFQTIGQRQYNFDGEPIVFQRNGSIDSADSLLFSADWNEFVYSLRQDLQFQVFTEGVIQDQAGNIVWNLLQQRLIAIMATVRLAWQVANPINWMNGDAATRYPAAVLVP